MDSVLLKKIKAKVTQYNTPNKRRAISSKYPFLSPYTVLLKRLVRNTKNYFLHGLPFKKEAPLPCVVARHSSPLYRKLGESDPNLQINKVHNLQLAIKALDGIVIPPGKTFSFWHHIGSTNTKKGYVKGMILSNGNVSEGIGGGLCQLSNFLFWILLHCDVEIIERYHHSVDTFPDSGRTIPFGGGATIFCNYIDLKIKNISKYPLQIKLWLTDNQLKGQILSNKNSETKFHIVEKNHFFIKNKNQYFRYNEIWREKYINGEKIDEEKITENFAPVRYDINEDYVKNNNLTVVSIEG